MNNCELTGKTAFVTGSSRGIGRAAADELAARGARVIFHASRPTELLKGKECFCGDLGDPAAVTGLADEMGKRGVSPDILVLNASVQSYTGVDSFLPEEFDRMFQVNVKSAFLLLNRLAPAMRRRKWGRIIFTGSINSDRPAMRLGVYSATKGALITLARACAREYAGDGITVNTVLPGVIATDRNAAALADPEFAEKLRRQIPAGRFGTPEDCAGVIAFLASENASYVTGAEIPVSGGWQL